MPIYFVWFITALLSVGGDANDQNLPQSGRLLYCVIIPAYRQLSGNVIADIAFRAGFTLPWLSRRSYALEFGSEDTREPLPAPSRLPS
jgi:hypothetical protein